MPNFVPIDRSTFRKNPNAGQTSAVIPGRSQVSVTEDIPGGLREWVSIGEVTVTPDPLSVSGRFALIRSIGNDGFAEDGDRTFSTKPGLSIVMEKTSHKVKWAVPSPDYLFDRIDAVVVCPNGHAHKMSELDDYESDDVYVTNICPDCGEVVEEIEYEDPRAVAAELGA